MSYMNIKKEKWRSFLNISGEDIPDKLIIEGHPNFPGWTEQRSTKLTNVRPAWMPNLVIGDNQGQSIGYGVGFGGPLVSQFVHIYSKLGTRKIVLIGTGGGLQKNIELGDIILSEGVLSLDGSWKLHRQRSKLVRFDDRLRERAARELKRRKVRFHMGRTVSFYDILLEERKDLIRLSKSGYLGVEMEAAATASAAAHLGVPSIALFTVSDNSISGKDMFYTQTDEDRAKIRKGRETVYQVALDI
jgi:uridine phosphorylase